MNGGGDGCHSPFDDLVEQLRSEGHEKLAGELSDMLHGTAWTTGSELTGELGLKVMEIRRHLSARSPALEASIEACMAAVRKVWPRER